MLGDEVFLKPWKRQYRTAILVHDVEQQIIAHQASPLFLSDDKMLQKQVPRPLLIPFLC